MRLKILILTLLSAIAFASPALAIKVLNPHAQAFKDMVKQGSNKPIPEITYYDLAGKPHNLKEHRGKVILLHFWATWCPPCIQELPTLDALQHHMREMAAIGDIERQPIEVVPISLDFRSLEGVKNFYNMRKIRDIPILFDKGNTAFYAFGVKNLPTTIIISPRGKEVGRVEGNYQWNLPEVEEYLMKFSEVQKK